MLDDCPQGYAPLSDGTLRDYCSPGAVSIRDLLSKFTDYAAVVDEKSTILACNPAFERLKASKSLLYVYSGKINFYDKQVLFWYQDFLADAQGTSDALYRVKDRENQTVLKLSRVRQKCVSTTELSGSLFLLLIDNFDENLRIERYKRFFNLTAAEALLAAKLSMGKTLNQLADEKLLSKHTLRTQLKSVFLKTETHSQNELIVLLKNVV